MLRGFIRFIFFDRRCQDRGRDWVGRGTWDVGCGLWDVQRRQHGRRNVPGNGGKLSRLNVAGWNPKERDVYFRRSLQGRKPATGDICKRALDPRSSADRSSWYPPEGRVEMGVSPNCGAARADRQSPRQGVTPQRMGLKTENPELTLYV